MLAQEQEQELEQARVPGRVLALAQAQVLVTVPARDSATARELAREPVGWG